MLTDAVMLQIAGAVARWFEFGGIAAIVVGSLVALARATQTLLGRRVPDPDGRPREFIAAFRRTLGRSILTGLELLVAADIIRTVAVEPTLQSVLVLGLIVLIRTFLSISLQVEIEGKWPWQRRVEG
jgi:uncharacterized membrane protein